MSAWAEYKKKLGPARPWDLLNPKIEKVSDEVADERMHICNDCAHLTVTRQCDQCGCFMSGKVKILRATCPLGKWGEQPA
jgi:hypothetical protein